MGFLDLIKMLKNAREETFANVYQAQRIEDQRNFAIKAFTKKKDVQDQEAIFNEITIMR